ncbi:MAG: carbohydrate kinase family protein [Patescibacteria group bacterium]
MSVLVSGSLVYDNIMNFPDSFKNHIMPENIHILNVCFIIDQLERSWGGTAGNIAYTINLLGADPILLSAVGSNGGDYIKYLNEVGIKTDHVLIDEDQLTASAFITTDADDNQITAFHNGPLGLAGQMCIAEIKEKFSVVLISPTQKEVMIKHLKESHELGYKTVFDPGQQITAFNQIELQKMISQSFFVIGNDYEMKLLQERSGWDAKKILSAAKVMITTLGEQGSIILTAEGESIGVKSCAPLLFDDPTGAGDAYRAGFFSGYEKEYDLKTCAQMGSVAASYAIETYGTQEHKFTREDFCGRYLKAYNETLNLK